MKRIFSFFVSVAVVWAMSGCDAQLDIIPKGQTTLSTVDELEMLLNQEYRLGTDAAADLGMICNESLGLMLNVGDVMTQKNTLNYAYLTYDDNVDRVTLSQNDARYEAIYKYINYMNVILAKMPHATGRGNKEQLMAQARIMRAYLHWLAVNIYAAQFDEQTANATGGIAYNDDANVQVLKPKLTVQKVYEKILNDCSDDVINLLPQNDEHNVLRADKAFGYAVRAKVLMQMKRYGEALPYAQKALSLNGTVEKRSNIVTTGMWELPQSAPNNYVYIAGGTRACPTTETLSEETGNLFEEGDFVMVYDGNWSTEYGEIFVGLPVKVYFGWSTSANVYGITADRMYYTLAECLIRTGNIREGLATIDRVRKERVENFRPFAQMFDEEPMDEVAAMQLLQNAKRIECIGSYETFFDCKRWNTEEKYAKTLVRNLEGFGRFSISPTSPLWILPFPANVTRFNSTMTQNY